MPHFQAHRMYWFTRKVRSSPTRSHRRADTVTGSGTMTGGPSLRSRSVRSTSSSSGQSRKPPTCLQAVGTDWCQSGTSLGCCCCSRPASSLKWICPPPGGISDLRRHVIRGYHLLLIINQWKTPPQQQQPEGVAVHEDGLVAIRRPKGACAPADAVVQHPTPQRAAPATQSDALEAAPPVCPECSSALQRFVSLRASTVELCASGRRCAAPTPAARRPHRLAGCFRSSPICVHTAHRLC